MTVLSNDSNPIKAARACVLCGPTAVSKPYATVAGYGYSRCNDCGLLYQSELPTREEFRDAYTGGVLKTWKRRLFSRFLRLNRTSGYDRGIQRAREIFMFSKSQLKQVLPPAVGGKILDVGCNKGYILAAAIEQGFDPWGIEYVPELLVPFRNTYPEYRSQVFSKKFSELRGVLEERSFDLITAIDVVEHFEDPIVDMKYLRQLLRPSGRLIVQTPDAGCDIAVSSGPSWGAMKPAEHLHLFNEQNFARFARDCGFSQITFHPAFEEADGNFVAVLET